MTAVLVELFPEEGASEPAVAAIVGVIAGAAALPVLRSFADHVQRRATVMMWAKTIVGVIICGALMALGNWIYTLFSAQWSHSGLPDLPPMLAKAGEKAPPPGTAAASGPIRGTAQAPAQSAQADFLHRYQD